MQNNIDIAGLKKEQLFEIINEIGREISYRKYCYPKWIQAGRMDEFTAKKRMSNMYDAYNILKFIYEHSAQDVQLKLFSVSH